MDQFSGSACVQYAEEPKGGNSLCKAVTLEILSHNTAAKGSKQKTNARKRMAQEEAFRNKQEGARFDEGVDDLASHSEQAKDGQQERDDVLLRQKQSTTNLPKQEGKSKWLSRKKKT